MRLNYLEHVLLLAKLQKLQIFFFGTNDLTQTTYGFSRDDVGTFLPHYIDTDIIKGDPFQSIDQDGVGELVKIESKSGEEAPMQNSKLVFAVNMVRP